MKFDKIVVVPSHFPPGKSAKAAYEKRLDWAKQVFKGETFEISSLEKSANQTVFGKEIFYKLSAASSETKFYWILGEDQWQQLKFWKEIDQYAGDLEWIVLVRDSKETQPSGILSKRLNRVSCAYEVAAVKPMAEISSTRIRKCIEEGALKSNELKWIPSEIKDDVIRVYKSKEDLT